MNQAVIFYNPFLPELKISVNGKKISTYSPLMSYRHQRFEKWCHNIFADLYREINSDYELLCISTDFICNWLEDLSEKNSHCISFSSEPLPMNNDVYDRLYKLEMLGLDEESDSICIPIINASQNDEMTDAVYEIISEQGVFEDVSEEGIVWSECPMVNIELKTCEYPDDVRGDYPCVIALCESESDYFSVPSDVPTYALVMGFETKFLRREGSKMFFSVDPDDLGEVIVNILEEEVLCPALSQISYNVSEEALRFMTDAEREELAMVCQASPTCKVTIPKVCDLGRAFDLNPQVIPSGCGAKYNIVSNNPFVIDVEDGMLCTRSAGIAEISVYVDGDPYPVATETVRVSERVLISNITLFPGTLYMGVGATESVSISVEPENAENLNEIEWESSDTLVAEVDAHTGEIFAKECGRCTITASTKETSARVNLYVQPKLEDIIIPSSFIEVNVGEQKECKFQAVPENAYGIDLLRTMSSDKNVAEYRGGYVFGKAVGECKIYIKNSSGSISRELRISVKKGRKFW